MVVDIDIITSSGDPRVTDWFLMESPTPTVLTSTIYVIFVTIIGPIWMQNKKPYELRSYMIAYNSLIVCLSIWIFIRFALYGWFNNYSWHCEPVDYSYNDDSVAVLTTCYAYYLTKFLELLDTVFFVLRKKRSQITFLHVFHHSYVPIAAWYLLKYGGGGGYSMLIPMVNTFVHIWMYSYYALSALGPSIQKFLWWKKHLTKLQLLQFTIMMIYMTRILITRPKDCNATDFIIWLHLGQAIAFFCLFIHFYIGTYLKKK